MKSPHLAAAWLFAMLVLAASTAAMSTATLSAAEIRIIKEDSKPTISGKEIDWIYGDYLMENDLIALTIAAPLPTRDANMTIRNIGGSILDLTLKEPANDQLSAYTPTAGRYLFQDAAQVTTGRDRDAVFWQCRSSRTRANDGTTATVRYRLADGDAYVEATVRIEGKSATAIKAIDGVRADGWFSFEKSARTAYCTDSFFRQTIGFQCPLGQQPPDWKRGRPYLLQYSKAQVKRGDDFLEWTVRIFPATCPIDLLSVAETSNVMPAMHQFKVDSPAPEPGVAWVNRAQVALRRTDTGAAAWGEAQTLQTDDAGVAHARLTPGDYVAIASAIGRGSVEVPFKVSRNSQVVTLPLKQPSGFDAEVVDEAGRPIPVKATIYAMGEKQPDYGLNSARTFVGNLVYSVHGRMRCPLEPGEYEVYFSRGPEYNSVRRMVTVPPGKRTTLKITLERVVDTTGWVSSDLHSHSSPSGDNTSEQYGRVENLLCEHLEFAPCTEHNRIDSYAPHLKRMQLSHLLATCTGMELTGAPTPVNHQNAFPLLHRPHTQNGGGPRMSYNPVAQIGRLAMWDKKSDKLVQMNHPNLHQIYGDADVDGVPDKGFREMLRFTDIVEVHPLETIFQDVVNNPPTRRRMRIPMFQWLQLLNDGVRIPGVINTDSHYNHHGSGWRRNWIASSSDDPTKISTVEMVRQLEAGRVVMSNGPFLSVTAGSMASPKPALPGDSLTCTDGKITLNVRVQCPNWLDVNRVQLFINGRPSKLHNYTRKSTPKRFGDFDSVTKFEASLEVSLEKDAHLIVGTIGEGLTMEKVMGRRFGKRPPIAVSNPIFVDVDGMGFQPNGDKLGMPLPKGAK